MKLGKIYGGIIAAGAILITFFGSLLPVQNPTSPAFLTLAGFTVYYLADIAEKLEEMNEEAGSQ